MESNMPEMSMPNLAEQVLVEDNKDDTDMEIVYDSWDMLHSMWKALVSDKSLDGEVMWSCIKFCYLFPKTHEFNKDDIIQLWIAEGFIPVTHIRLETTAGLYIEALQELSIFHFSFLASTGEPRYKLNPSIVDLFEERHSALDEYYRVDDGGNSCISENTLHSSFRDSIDPVTLKDLFQAKNLCSLMILHQHGSHIEQVPRDLFLNLRSLRVLDFSHTRITELPSTIRYLKDLRLLNLSGTPIQALPNSLGSLSQMQTLKLRDCFKLLSLPKCIRKLINLRHLEANVASLLVSMPPGLGDLTELQTLPAFVVGKENGCHITELKHMVNVHGTLHILRLENVFSLEEAKEAALDQLKYIQKLELQWSELHDGHEILENLRPHMELEELQIVGYGDAKFPTWIGDPIFSKLTTITIHDCRKCELLSPLGKLPLLKALSVSKMHEVKVINHQFCGRDMDNESLDLERLDRGTVYENLSSYKAFMRLVSLTLNEIPKLEKWTGVVVGDFPQLQKLNIFDCSKLITLPQLSLLSSLKKLEIRLCPSLESFPMKGLPNSLQHLVIIDCPLLKEFCQKEQEEQWTKLVHIPNVWVDYLQISALRHSEFLQKVSAQRLGNELAKPSETESAQLSEIESAQALEIEPGQPSETESTKLSEVVLLQRLEIETTQPSKTKPNQQLEIESAQSSHNMSQLSTKERSWLSQWHRLYKFLKKAQSKLRFARMRKAQTSVSTGVKKLSIPCWKPAVEGEEGNLKSRYDIGRVDGLLCHKDLGHDNKVESPMTVTRANNLLEDQSQVESGPLSLEFSASTSAQRLETEPAKPSEIESTKMFEILPAQPSGIELAKRSEIESALVLEAEPAQPSNTESPSRHRLAQPSEIESAQSSHSMSHVSITESDQPSKTKSAKHSEIESVESSHDMSQISTNERPDKDAAVPTFGEWDETNPASDDGFTVIFNKIREEKLTGSTNTVAERDEQFYSVKHKQDSNNSTRSNWNCAWMREAKTSVSSGIKKKIIPCCMLAEGYYSNSRYSSGRVDKLLWSMDLGHHFNGEFSMAVTQANNLLEDQSQVESGPLGSMNSSPRGTFVGIYDGHGGPEAARFINDHLFNNLKKSTSNHRNMSVDVIREAYSATEEEFLCLVQKEWLIKPQMASVGSCCLVGIVCAGTLYIANVGNSRVVLGRSEKASMDVTAIQLSTEHDASIESIREELRSLHPHDSQIVVLKRGVWRVKGIIKISRSIGDAYLKRAEFNREPLYQKFKLREPFQTPILSSEPSVLVQKLHPLDEFLIFASDGLWEHLSNEQAVKIVHRHPRKGIARRLIQAALQEAAKKTEMRYSDLKRIERGVRRHFHDDITVIVLFLDSIPSSTSSSYHSSNISIRGGGKWSELGLEQPSKLKH